MKDADPRRPQPAGPLRKLGDLVLLLMTAVAVMVVLCLVTATFARAVLQDPRLSAVSPRLLALLTVTAILTAMVLCFVAFFRGRRAARRRTPITAYPEHSVVRILTPKTDDRGRTVKAGATGTIVHVYPTKPSESPAYIVEVVPGDAKGTPKEAHVFDARHEEVELCS